MEENYKLKIWLKSAIVFDKNIQYLAVGSLVIFLIFLKEFVVFYNIFALIIVCSYVLSIILIIFTHYLSREASKNDYIENKIKKEKFDY